VSHPFGDLLKQYRRRRPGLTQERLAHMIGYDEAVLVRMSQGKKDLTGPSGRDRVLRLIETLKDEGVLHTLDEANALLAAAQMPPLYNGIPVERVLINALKPVATAMPESSAPAHFTPPSPASSLVGREEDIAEITRLLQAARLITLTGAGGSGKTRLALEAGARHAGDFTHGACFVNLAVVRHVNDVVPAIAQALNVPDAEQASLLEPIKRFIAGKSILLVLDNFEHVLEGATVASALLMAAPHVKILATSREPLRLSGEHVYIVEPLALPRAVELFTQRTQAVKPAFRLTRQNEPAVMEICRRMDGLPLAIELAAARMRHLSPEAVLASLNAQRGLGVVTFAPREAPARHHTLRSAIAWSYQLLSDDEQRVLRLLGVFAGGAETQQIADVIDELQGESSGSASPALNTHLQSLVDKNLVRAIEQPDGTLRYFLLELIREFALEQLSAHDNLRSAQRAHANAFLQLAAQSMIPILGHEQIRWHERLERDYPNLRAALGWSFGEAGDEVIGCRLVEALSYFWFIATRYIAESRSWIDKARSAQGDVPLAVRAGVLSCMIYNDQLWSFAERAAIGREALHIFSALGDTWGIGQANYFIGGGLLGMNPHDEEGLRAINECLAFSRVVKEPLLESHALFIIGTQAKDVNDLERAEALHREFVALRRQMGNRVEVGIGLWQLAGVLALRGRLQEANDILHESIAIAKQVDSPQDLLHAECAMGDNLRALGQIDDAISLLSACAAMAQERLPLNDKIQPLIYLAHAWLDAGDPARACALLREAAEIIRSCGWPAGHIPWQQVVDMGAERAFAEGDAERAVMLWSAAAHWWKQPRSAPALQTRAQLQVLARNQLGDAVYEAACSAGETLSMENAIALSLGEAVNENSS
jgi:predicted ATPase